MTRLFQYGLLISTILLTLTMPLLSLAQSGGTAGGGGSTMEPEFKAIATNIKDWINSGNAKALTLPSDVSYEQYKQKMLKELSQYNIEMTNKVVTFGGKEKTCRSAKNSAGKNFIQCNIARFENDYKNNINGTYSLVHHEFAGLALLERNIGAESDYRISNHISKFLREETVMRLPVDSVDSKVIDRKIEICGENEIRETIEIESLSEDYDPFEHPKGFVVDPKNYFTWARANTKSPLALKLNQVATKRAKEKSLEYDETIQAQPENIEIDTENKMEVSSDFRIPQYYENRFLVAGTEYDRRAKYKLFTIEFSVNQFNKTVLSEEYGEKLTAGDGKWEQRTYIEQFDSTEVSYNDNSCRPPSKSELKILLAK